ncbi:MAG: hypothetical protein JXR78_17375 [Victivallales bacterium]|nr:hypothetical protein [Victivallales bacterium]
MGVTKRELSWKNGALYFFALFFIASLSGFADAGGDWSTLFSPSGIVPNLSSSTRTNNVTFPEIRLRRKNLLVIGAQSGSDINVILSHKQISTYTNDGTWELRKADMTYIDHGDLELGGTETISYTPVDDEVVYLCVDMGSNAFVVQSSSAPIGIVASKEATLIDNSGRELFINIPSTWKKVSLTAYANNVNENVKIELYDPNNTIIAQGQTDASNQEVVISSGETEDYSGMVLTLKILPPTNGGYLDDYKIKLNGHIPPVLTFVDQDKFTFSHFGSGKKLAVVVDKVLAASNSYDVEDWMVQEFFEAGFDIYLAREFSNKLKPPKTDLEQLEELADWCEAKKMKTLMWMRATLKTELTEPDSAGKRYLPGTNEISIWSPNSQQLWDYLEENIIDYATLSKTSPGLLGVFLDFEDYSPEKHSAPTITTYYVRFSPKAGQLE